MHKPLLILTLFFVVCGCNSAPKSHPDESNILEHPEPTYLRKVFGELRDKVPHKDSLRPGRTVVKFQVDPQGQINTIDIPEAPSHEQAEFMRTVFNSLHVSPPPDGKTAYMISVFDIK